MAFLSTHDNAPLNTDAMSNWGTVIQSMTFTSFQNGQITLSSGTTTVVITGDFQSRGGGETLSSFSGTTAVTGVSMTSTDDSVEYVTSQLSITLQEVLSSRTPYDVLGNDNVRIDGGNASDHISGTGGKDFIIGFDGDDWLSGLGGNDSINGGGGNDVVHYSGLVSDYIIAILPSGYYSVTDTRAGSPDGTDTLSTVETLSFGDGTVGNIADLVTDKPPTPPTLSSLTVAENAPAGTIIGAISSIDPEGLDVTYRVLQEDRSFKSGRLLIESENFAVVNGNLVVKAPLDYETSLDNPYRVQIIATDRGVNTITSFFTILPLDREETINGTARSETIHGGIGADRINGLDGNDKLYGRNGNDVLVGDAGNDTLVGGTGDDRLVGGTGDDALYGDAGKDMLTGGSGRDVFYFRALIDSAPTARDVISDFSKSDIIHLKTMDADITKAGDQAFDFIGKNSFSGDAGELRYKIVAGTTYLEADVNGDRGVDFSIILTGALSLNDGSFIL